MTTLTPELDAAALRRSARVERTTLRMDPSDLPASCDTILNRWPTVGFGAGVVRDGHLEAFYGHGLADVATGLPITEDTVFRIASISKTFTAIAVMQLWEQGLVDLDRPANDYLSAYRLIPAKDTFRPPTLRHLLTHTAGIPEVLHPSDLLRPDWGDSVPMGERLPSLAEVYGRGIRLDKEPGSSFAYTNHAFATLQQVVEDVTATPFGRYLREHILEPLGMVDTDIVRSPSLASRLATGYAIGSRGARAVTDRDWVTPGASSIYSTVRDMSRYIGGLLGGGTNERGTVLRTDTVAMMFDPHYRPDPRVPGMGLGFDRGMTGGHRIVGHGGILPGFNSQMFLAPDDGIGVIAFTNGATRAMLWLPTELGRLLSGLIGVDDDAIRTDVPQHPERWGELRGWYQNPARLMDVRARLMIGAGVEVGARGDRLWLRILSPVPALYRGFELHADDPEDPDVFRIDLREFGLPTARIVFSHASGRPATAIHMDLFPASAYRRSGLTNPRSWAAGALGALGVTTAAVVVRRRRMEPRSAQRDGR